MSTFAQFLVLGLCSGGLYALSALGVVLVYRVSSVINFANGAIGMVGTYLFYELHEVQDWSFALAIVPCVAGGSLVGYLCGTLLMARFRNASQLVRLLVTIGILISVQGALALRYPDELLVMTSSLPTGGIHLGVVVGKDKVIILALVAVLSATLFFVYRYTRFGVATTAVSDSAVVAESLGYSANRIAAYNWAVASALSTLAGILLAPIVGLTVGMLTTLLVPALAAAVLGSLRSFAVAFWAALAIGVVQSEMSWYVTAPGWSASVPFVVIIVVLAIRGSTLPGRGVEAIKLPGVGAGTLNLTAVVCGLVAALAVIGLAPVEWVNGLAVTVGVGVVLLSFVVLTGYAGQLSLAQYALAGFGAFVAGRLVATEQMPFIAALLIGVVAAAPVGFIIGLPAVRTRGSNLAVVTLGFSVAIEALLFNNPDLTGGAAGTSVGFPHPFGHDISAIIHPRSYAVFSLVAFALVALCLANLRRGPMGRRLLAIRANERGAASLGVSVVAMKLYAFVVGAMIAGLGGIILAFRNPTIVYTDFTAFTSVTLVGEAIVGGVGYVMGPFVGATLEPASLGTNVTNAVFGEGAQEYLGVLAGLILILILIQAPDGAASHMAGLARRILGRISSLARRGRRQPPAAPATARAGRPGVSRGNRPVGHRGLHRKSLSLAGATVSYGSFKALDDVSLEVAPGRVVGLIGPNGAGKTTLIDAVTGFTNLRGGDITLDGISIVGKTPQAVAKLGVGRSFQSLELFDDMTVLENLLVATERPSRVRLLRDLVWPGKPKIEPVTDLVVDDFELRDDLGTRVSDLPFGRRRLVAIARAIAGQPSILLLDEPGAGLSEAERAELVDLVRTLAAEWGIGVLLVEHDVELVMRTCDEIVVLDFGQVIARGTPAEVRSDPKVIEAYLGTPAEHMPNRSFQHAAGGSPALVGEANPMTTQGR